MGPFPAVQQGTRGGTAGPGQEKAAAFWQCQLSHQHLCWCKLVRSLVLNPIFQIWLFFAVCTSAGGAIGVA